MVRLQNPSTFRLFRDVCGELAKNMAMGLPPVRKWRIARDRTATSYSLNSELRLERYAFQALRSLHRILGNTKGLRILEIGPGDNIGSGLCLLAAGAASYTAVERFAPDYSADSAKAWYRSIQEAWPQTFRDWPWPDDIDWRQFPEAFSRVRVLPGDIEALDIADRFDVVCSFQVLEHVKEIGAFARQNARLLGPGGVGVHRVHFGPHDCWEPYPDPLTFLRFPDWLWHLMGSNRATPNRHRFHEWNAAFENVGLAAAVIATDAVAEDRVKHSSLAARFRQMPKESLDIMSAIYVCRAS